MSNNSAKKRKAPRTDAKDKTKKRTIVTLPSLDNFLALVPSAAERIPSAAERGRALCARFFETGPAMPAHVGARLLLDDTATGSYCLLLPNALGKALADTLLRVLLAHDGWHTEHIMMHGKSVATPRSVSSFGYAVYPYAGRVERPTCNGWGDAALAHQFITDNLVLNHAFNYGHANRYTGGKQYIGDHADDERSMVDGAPIVGLTLADPTGERDFRIRKRCKGGAIVCTHRLPHGSIVVMLGAMQRHYKHGVPPRANRPGTRINVTFRVMCKAVSSHEK